MKYVWRWPHKNGAEDIEKAIDCLRKLLAEELVGVTADADHDAEPRDPVQCTECARCKQDGVTLLCDLTKGMHCSMAYGTKVCERNRRKAAPRC